MFPPNFAHDKLELLYSGMLESLQIAIIATVAGVLLSLPLGLMAARNLSPLPLAWAARALIALFRTFHPVIVAILFVKAVGFGALAGMLALIVASLGFIGKLVAEAVEEMSMQQVEAVRATGAPFLSLVIMGVLPQVMPRFIGFSAYQLDSNLRNSALVGLVGGGGIGAHAVHRVSALRLRFRAAPSCSPSSRSSWSARSCPAGCAGCSNERPDHSRASRRIRCAVGNASRPPSG